MKFRRNSTNIGDGLDLLKSLKKSTVPLVIFDPQYRGILNRMSYGNEGKSRMSARSRLPQMGPLMICDFATEIIRVLRPSGHLMMWVDKFAMCEERVKISGLQCVDLITWEKRRIGMGYRTRRKCEYLLIYQKPPMRAKGCWTDRGIPDVWTKEMEYGGKYFQADPDDPTIRHPHQKPVGLQRRLIEAVTKKGQLVVDPCAGGYSVMRSARSCGRQYLGTDII